MLGLPKPYFNPHYRLPRREAMTIIAGFRGSDSIVMAADTQETIGEHLKVSVPKLKDCYGERWKAIVGGAGASKMIDLLFERIDGIDNDTCDVLDFRNELESILHDVYTRHIYSAPSGIREYLDISLLIGLWTSKNGMNLIETSGTASLIVERGYSCIGWGESHAKKISEQKYMPNMPREWTVLLANYVINQTKRWEPQCGGDTHVMAIGPIEDTCAVWKPSPDQAKDDETYSDAFDLLMQWPFYLCGDVAFSDGEIQQVASYVAELLKILGAMRRQQKEARDSREATMEKIKEMIATQLASQISKRTNS
jgi:20S proteasome alpha/beta subunit